jgi:hypothetical protein
LSCFALFACRVSIATLPGIETYRGTSAVIQNILKKLRAGKSSAAEIEDALSRINIDEMERAAEELEAERRRILLDGSDKDLEAIEARITVANRDIERAVAAKEELERRLGDAVAAEQNGERLARYRTAKAKGEQAAARLAKEYPGYAKGIVDLIRIIAEATVEVQLVNESLPAGVDPLPDPEFSVRGLPGLPRKIISEREVELWFYVNNNNIAPEAIWKDLDREDHDGDGVVDRAGYNSPQRFEKRRFIKRDYLEREQMVHPARLAGINLPGVVAGDMPYWREPAVNDARAILSCLTTISEHKPAARKDRREARIEYIPVEPPPAIAQETGASSDEEAEVEGA